MPPDNPDHMSAMWLLHNILDKLLGVFAPWWLTIVHHGGTKTQRDTEILAEEMRGQGRYCVVQHPRDAGAMRIKY